MNASPFHVLQLIFFLDTICAGMLLPQLATHMMSLGGSHITIGVMGALYSGVQLFSEPFIGCLGDVRGRKPILLLCLSVCGVSYFALGLTSSAYIFLVLRGILGLMKQTKLLSKALAPDYVNDTNNQSVLYGRFASLAGVGMSVGPIIGGHIMEANSDYGFTIITTIMGALFAVNIGMTNLLPDSKQSTKTDKEPNKETNVSAPKLIELLRAPMKESIDEFYKINWSIYGDIFLLKLIMTLSMEMFYRNYGMFLKTIHNVSPKHLGYIISLLGVTGSICTYFIGHINQLYKNDKDYSERNYHFFIIIATTLFGLAMAPNVYIYSAILIPLAMASSIGKIISLEMVTRRSTSETRGTVIGALNSFRSLSGVLVPLVAGVVNQYLGIWFSFIVAASFAIVGIVVSRRIRLASSRNKDK